ncbi:argininosuccinate synthase [Hydrogenophaga soli]
MNDKKRVVLAYSGGVDTTACIPYLRHEMGCDYIVAMVADLGQGDELGPICEKAKLAGADVAIAVDVKDHFVRDYGFTALRANALYDKRYPLSSALGRPLIGDLLVKYAHEYKCGSVAHGCTGKGNDQVRLDLTVALGDPNLNILAPAREWGFTRSETIAYSERFGIPPHVTKERPWAIDLNILGRNVEAGLIEDLNWEPTEEVWSLTRSVQDAPEKPAYVSLRFEQGYPVAIDGKVLSPLKLVATLNHLAGTHGIGRIDMIENRVVGVKTRELYEAPAMQVLIQAHQDLESLTLPADLLQQKHALEDSYARLIYQGLWFTPLKQSIDAFISYGQQFVNGSITLRLFKGCATIVKRTVDQSLYRLSLVTYDRGCDFNQSSSTGFIDIFGLPHRIWSEIHARPNLEKTPEHV